MVINSKEDVGVLPPQLPTAVPTSTAIWEKKMGSVHLISKKGYLHAGGSKGKDTLL